MYCPECGKYNEDRASFCRFCGARLEDNTGAQAPQGAGNPGGYSEQAAQNNQQYQNIQQYQNTQPEQAIQPNQAVQPNQVMQAAQNIQPDMNKADDGQNRPVKKKGKKIWLIIAAVLVLAVAAAAAVFLWILPQQKEKNYKANIADGNRYLEEMDYKKAEDSYLAAIEIEPKEPEPYLKLAEIYEVQNEPEKVVEILKKGTENTDSPEIQEKYDLYSYVQDVLIPEEGQVEEGEYICSYIEQPWANTAWVGLDPVHSEKGILTSRIRDFDNDGKDELFVLSLKNDAREYEYTKVDQNEVIMRMYESRDGEVELSDETSALCPVLGEGNEETSGIFLHENEGQIYICGSLRQHWKIYGDGTKAFSFVSVYDGETFVKLAGTDEAVGGSDFYSTEKPYADEMADFLDEIGLPEEADQIRESGLRCFEFGDDVEMLMQVIGKNDGQGDAGIYGETGDPADLGKVILTLKLTWDETQEKNSEQDEGQNSDDGQDVEAAAAAARKAYDDLLESKAYNDYTSEWMAEPESYSIVDINQDQIPELLVHSASDGFGWFNALLFVYDRDEQKVKMVQDIYYYAAIQYSEKYKAITFSEVRSSMMYGGRGFYTLDGTELTYAFTVGWDSEGDRTYYFISEADEKKEITEAQSDAYFDELTEIQNTAL